MMKNFGLSIPTRLVFGIGELKRMAKLPLPGKKALIVISAGTSMKQFGYLDTVVAQLKEAGVESVIFDKIQPNPTKVHVDEGAALCKAEGCDFVLGLGGGSSIDTAKAIAVGYYYEGDFWDFYCGKAQAQKALPVGVVLTIPAAGSEGSGNTVITNTTTRVKAGIRLPFLLRPKFAVMNPELTMTLPEWQTASGITDMMAHILERYMSNTEDVQIGDRMAEGILLAIMDVAPRVIANPNDYEARANIMWCGTIAHNDTCSIGRQEDWNSHAMEHEISAEYDVTHGAGLAVVFPAFLDYAADHNPHKVAQLGYRVLGIENTGNLSADAHKAASALRTWLHDVLHMPVTFSQLGVPNPDLELLNTRLHKLKGEIMQGYMQLDYNATMEIYKKAL